MWLHLLLDCVLIFTGSCSQKDHTTVDSNCCNEKELIKLLLDDYDSRARPVLNSSHPVNVKFGITPILISDMDEVNQVFAMDVWLQHIWIDERLKWDPQKYNNLSKLRIPQKAIWLPDIVLYNSAEDHVENMNTKLTVENNGRVFWGPPTRFQASCNIDVTYFPFDVQLCELKFSSWMYDWKQLDISIAEDKVDMKEYVPNGEWDLLNISAFKSSAVYDCCLEPYPYVTYQVLIKRRVLYYLFNIVCPCISLALLCVMTFLLPADSGEKITLGITVLLALSVFLLLVAESMPKTSESIPLIGIYLTFIECLTSMSMLLTIIILHIHHVGPRQKKMPMWLQSFAFNHIAKLLHLQSIVHNYVEDSPDYIQYNSSNILSDTVLESVAKRLAELEKEGLDDASNNIAKIVKALVTKDLKKNVGHQQEIKKQKIIGDEWQLLAIILHRLFFCIFIVVTSVFTIGILVLMPIFGPWFLVTIEKRIL